MRGAATLVIAATGHASGLERVMRALSKQTLKPHQIILAVESRNDPAFATAEQITSHPPAFPVSIVIAGDAVRCSQKSHNLITASQHISKDADVVVFLDDDIDPPTWWLSALVSPLRQDGCDIVTGYRWPIIEEQTLGAHLVATIDRTIAVLPRPKGAHLAWGGSIAISRKAFDQLDFERILADNLSDDLSIGTAAAALGLRVLARRALLVPSPNRSSAATAWRFGLRQYRIMRIYRPLVWSSALLIMTCQVGAWALLATQLTSSKVAGLVFALLIGFGLAKVWVLDRIGKRLGVADATTTRLLQIGLALLKPAIDVFHLSMIFAAANTRELNWGHITYRVDGPDRVSISARRKWLVSSS